MTPHEKALAQIQRHLAALLMLRFLLPLLTVAAFAWGTAVLGLRTMLGTTRLPLLWGLVGLPVAAVIAVILARRRLPARTALRALLDRESRGGGLVMTAEETPLGRWLERVPAPVLPQIRWQAGRAWMLLGIATAFLLATFAIPDRYTHLVGEPLEVGPEVARLDRQVRVLKEEAILEPTRAESWQKKLEQLRDEASGKDPVKTLEALDHIRNMTAQGARQAAEQAARKKEELADAQAGLDLLRKKRKDMTSRQLGQAMAELDVLTRKAAAESGLTRGHVDPDRLQSALDGKLSSKELKDLLDELDKSKEDLDELLEKLRSCGAIDSECLSRCKKCGNNKDLEDFLEKHAKLKACCAGSKPGKGGISRGPAPASLELKNNTPEEELKLRAQTLPPGAIELGKSQLRGLSKGAPQVGSSAQPGQSGALAGAQADGGSANTQVVLPRHRGTVRRYFYRNEK